MDDNFISYLDVLVTPLAALPAMTSDLSFRLISKCALQCCHLRTEMNLNFSIGHIVPKASDEVGMCSAFRWQLESRAEAVKGEEWALFFFKYCNFIEIQLTHLNDIIQ